MVALFRLFSVLILFAGSVLLAPSQSGMAGLSQIEVCGSNGAETLVLDAGGNPVGPQHLCPDCIACVAIGPLPVTGRLRLTGAGVPFSHPLPRAIVAAGIIAIDPTARDPPLSV